MNSVNFGWEKLETRFEHMWVVANTGAGKTTMFRALAAYDIPRVEMGGQSLIIMDSEGQLLSEIAQLEVFNRVPLHILDPEADMGFNPFYTTSYGEKEVGAIINTVSYFIGSLLEGEMTPKQRGLFNRVVDALIFTHEPTLMTLLEVLEGTTQITLTRDHPKREEYQRFFSTAFLKDAEFIATRQQLVWRVQNVFSESPAFKRVFADPRGIDYSKLMDEPGVTLINTRRALWDEEGVGIFGRLCLAGIKRAGFKPQRYAVGLPCFVYMDEAHLYVQNDQNAIKMLDGIRKYNVGIILAHQRVSHMSSEMQDALSENAGTFMASQIRDPRLFASIMGCTPQFITGCEVGQFAVFIPREMSEAKRVRVPDQELAKMPKRRYLPPPPAAATQEPPPQQERAPPPPEPPPKPPPRQERAERAERPRYTPPPPRPEKAEEREEEPAAARGWTRDKYGPVPEPPVQDAEWTEAAPEEERPSTALVRWFGAKVGQKPNPKKKTTRGTRGGQKKKRSDAEWGSER